MQLAQITDLERDEYRFLIDRRCFSELLIWLSTFFIEKVFGGGVVRTVYFNDEGYSVPWGYSLRARKYLNDFSNEISFEPNDIYQIQLKHSLGDFRTKEKIDCPFAECAAIFEKKISRNGPIGLRPYIVCEYRRKHFVSRKSEHLRVTVDYDVKFYFLEEDTLKAIPIGGEDFIRLEIKENKTGNGSDEHLIIERILNNLGALPVISKREHAFGFAGLHIDKRGNRLFKELKNQELEAKFMVDHPNPAQLLNDLRCYLMKCQPFTVPAHYPYMQGGAGLNYYWSHFDNVVKMECAKLRFIGQSFKPVLKKGNELIISENRNAIVLCRQEIKEQARFLSPAVLFRYLGDLDIRLGPLQAEGHFLRSRRAFWPENLDTGRVFHISIDRSSAIKNNELWQMEIEYTGCFPETKLEPDKKKAKRKIAREIIQLSDVVLDFCNKNKTCLAPTTLTKYDWLTK